MCIQVSDCYLCVCRFRQISTCPKCELNEKKKNDEKKKHKKQKKTQRRYERSTYVG